MSEPAIFSVLNIYGLLTNVFSSISYTEKLLFEQVSTKCKKLIEHRLIDELICDDFDEFICVKKNQKYKTKFIPKFITDSVSEYLLRNFYCKEKQIVQFDIFQTLVNYMISKKSIIFFKRIFISSSNNRCCAGYIIHSMVMTSIITDDYRSIVNNHVLNFACENNFRCSDCIRTIYSSIEKDIIPPAFFYDKLNSGHIFDLMITAGAHGSYKMFITLYNYLTNVLKNKIYQTDMIILIICYYKNYYLTNKHQKLFIYTSLNPANLNHDKIIRWLATINGLTNLLTDFDIFKKIGQKMIKDLLLVCINNKSMLGTEFFIKYLDKLDQQILSEILLKKMPNDKLKKILIDKYDQTANIISNDDCLDIEIKISKHNQKSINMFKKYYYNLYRL